MGSGNDGASVAAAPSVWPLPGVAAGHLHGYEAALKELVARDGQRGSVHSMRLTETGVDVLTLLSVDFEVEREKAAAAALNQTAAGADCLPRII